MKSIFLAGASGAVGLPLAKLLVSTGDYAVFGTTRNPATAQRLREIGVTPVLVDVYDPSRLKSELQSVKPDIVIHQLTDLPYGLPKDRMPAAQIRNSRIRAEGTRNLIEAIRPIELERFLVQSIAFMYAEGPLPHTEAEPNGTEPLREFENMPLDYSPNTRIMRYGRFYGPGTGVDKLELPCRVHVEAAAQACYLLLSEGTGRIYNVCEDSDYASNSRIMAETSWNPDFRMDPP